jgi:hypothetical protein
MYRISSGIYVLCEVTSLMRLYKTEKYGGTK